MPARREADDADAMGVEVPLPGIGTGHADGPLRIEQRHEGPSAREPVLQHDARDAMLVEPLGDAVPLRAGHQAAVSAARADHHGRPVGLLGGRSVDGDGRSGCLELAVAHGRLVGPQREPFGIGRRRPHAAGEPGRNDRDGDCRQQRFPTKTIAEPYHAVHDGFLIAVSMILPEPPSAGGMKQNTIEPAGWHPIHLGPTKPAGLLKSPAFAPAFVAIGAAASGARQFCRALVAPAFHIVWFLEPGIVPEPRHG